MAGKPKRKDAKDTVMEVLQGIETKIIHDSMQEYERQFLTAAERQEYDMIAKYMKMGVNPNCYHPFEKDTALHIIAERGDVKMAELLYKTGQLDLNIYSPHGNPPLITAVMSRHDEFVKFMLSKGAKINITDRFKRTPLHHAVSMDWIDLVKLLLRCGCDRNPIDAFFETPLSLACAYNFEQMVHLLVDSGADVNLYRGDLVSHIFLDVCLQCRTEKEMRVIQYLVAKGAHPNVSHGHTHRNAMHLIAITNYLPLAEVLNRLGTSPFDKDVCQMLPFHVAKRHGHFDMADVLEEYYLQQYAREISQCMLGVAVRQIQVPKRDGDDTSISTTTSTYTV